MVRAAVVPPKKIVGAYRRKKERDERKCINAKASLSAVWFCCRLPLIPTVWLVPQCAADYTVQGTWTAWQTRRSDCLFASIIVLWLWWRRWLRCWRAQRPHMRHAWILSFLSFGCISFDLHAAIVRSTRVHYILTLFAILICVAVHVMAEYVMKSIRAWIRKTIYNEDKWRRPEAIRTSSEPKQFSIVVHTWGVSEIQINRDSNHGTHHANEKQ